MSNLKPKKNFSIPNFSSHYPSICCPPSPELEEPKTIARRFQRAVSFPIQKSHAIKRSSYKTRSSSLPDHRFHPIVSNLDDDVASLKSWVSSQSPSTTWLSDGAGLISLVLSSLSDLLHHPLVLDPLRKSLVTDSFSNDLMRLADSYESFRSCLLNLLHLQAETHASFRRRDASRLASAVRAQRRAGRELKQLSYAIQTTVQTSPPQLPDTSVSPDNSGVVMLPVSMCNSAIVLASASAIVFRGLAEVSDDLTASIATTIVAAEDHTRNGNIVRVWWVADLLRWKFRAKRNLSVMNHNMKHDLVMERKIERKMEVKMEVKMEEEEKQRKMAMVRLERLEESIRAMEIICEKIFRGLVKARVFLLNLLTPSS
ncbi:hypothetical protein LUZ60_016727 [Juncus effusus]|nr:hypothetical protein LUZ60_016727 [Juncus effusus]